MLSAGVTATHISGSAVASCVFCAAGERQFFRNNDASHKLTSKSLIFAMGCRKSC